MPPPCSLEFRVGDKPLNSFRMIELHYVHVGALPGWRVAGLWQHCISRASSAAVCVQPHKAQEVLSAGKEPAALLCNGVQHQRSCFKVCHPCGCPLCTLDSRLMAAAPVCWHTHNDEVG